ncbi:RsmB/NOP family class I SAM-dependent RNA methyltransferase [Candidatus Gracilibacteria bacterium]|nr:RsmB/NOP family class I SAM-dependent RNA methyltransferase [Candidatus Gracilibacteria bacterium]
MVLDKFFERLNKIYSQNDVKIAMEGFNGERITSFRVNTIKSNNEEIEEFLNLNNIEFKKNDFLENTYILDKKDEFFIKGSPIFYDGKIYLQGIASLIPATILNPISGDKVLDVTASPGSKTTQICAMMKNKGEIIACEKNQIRFDKLNYNLNIQGCNIAESIKMDSINLKDKFKNGYFNKILFDAPCSAEGRINLKNEKSYGFWTEKNILDKQKLQLDIFESIVPLLASGGEIVYSTCTLAPEENEEVVNIICEKYSLVIEEISLDFEYTRNGLTEFNSKKYSKDLSKTLRILPSKISEGFFIAKLRKI